jgi:hypothetical protein
MIQDGDNFVLKVITESLNKVIRATLDAGGEVILYHGHTRAWMGTTTKLAVEWVVENLIYDQRVRHAIDASANENDAFCNAILSDAIGANRLMHEALVERQQRELATHTRFSRWGGSYCRFDYWTRRYEQLKGETPTPEHRIALSVITDDDNEHIAQLGRGDFDTGVRGLLGLGYDLLLRRQSIELLGEELRREVVA